MYYEHFGLNQAPFKITPNTDFFFTGGNRGPVLEALIYAITHGEGIVKVSGEVGSGKTMLCNMLQSRLPDSVESVYLANPSVAPEEVLHAIAFELQLGVDRGADRLEVMHFLQDYLVQRHAEGKRVVVFVEESQSMPLATLEEIRLLSNLETRTDKLLQIVLFGQPELDETLRRPDIRQLRDRIAHSFRLEPLGDDQVREYLMFRMRAAGYRGPEIFSTQVVRQIAEASSGLTRRINLIADKALLAAFSENTHTLQARHVRAALRDSEFSPPAHGRRFSPRYAWAAVAMLVGTALGASLYAFLDGRFAPRAIRPLPTVAETLRQAVPAITSVAPVQAPNLASAGNTPEATAKRSTQGDSRSTETVGIGKGTRTASMAAAPASADPKESMRSLKTESQPVTPEEVRPISAKAERPADSTPPAPPDIIARRIEATAQLLKGSAADAYSIQLFVAGSEEQLRNHLKSLPKFIEMNNLYMYRSVAQGRPKVNVLWGSYPSRDEALEWIDELPPSLRANRPYVRTVEAIRAEMNRSSASR